MSGRAKKAPERVSGRYAAIPHSVLDSPAYAACSHLARALLLEVSRQHTGSNNGHIRMSQGWLQERGWCTASIYRGRDELLHNRLIVKTRDGGLNNGPHLYALTWHAISNFTGLDITQKEFHPGAYLLPPPVPMKLPEKKARKPSPEATEKQNPHLPRRVANALSTLPRRLVEEVSYSAAQMEKGRFSAVAYSAAQTQVKEAIPCGKFFKAALARNHRAARMAPRDWIN